MLIDLVVLESWDSVDSLVVSLAVAIAARKVGSLVQIGSGDLLLQEPLAIVLDEAHSVLTKSSSTTYLQRRGRGTQSKCSVIALSRSGPTRIRERTLCELAIGP